MLEAYCNNGSIMDSDESSGYNILKFDTVPEQIWHSSTMSKDMKTIVLNLPGLYTVEFYASFGCSASAPQTSYALFADDKMVIQAKSTEGAGAGTKGNVSFSTRVRCGVGEKANKLQIRCVEGGGDLLNAGIIVRFLGHNT